MRHAHGVSAFPCTDSFKRGHRQKWLGRSLVYKRACFVMTDHVMALPAFGAYTGGLDITSDVFVQAFGPAAQVHLCYRGQVLPVAPPVPRG